jgi:hypothetical protein
VTWLRFRFGREDEQTVNLWSRRLLQAQLDLSDKQADRDAAFRAHRERLQKVDAIARARLDLGGSSRPVDSIEKEMKNYETVRQQFDGVGKQVTPEQVFHASVRLLLAQQNARRWFEAKHKEPGSRLGDKMLDRLKADYGFDLRDGKSEFQAHLDRVRKLEQITRLRSQAGLYAALEEQTAIFYRLEAEEWLSQGKAFKEDTLTPDDPSKE